MDASQVKDILTTQNVIDLLEDLGGSPRLKGNVLYSRTICHHGDSHKLLYYQDSKAFHCYTGCGCNYDIFSLVEKVMSLSFAEALQYVCMKFGIVFRGNKSSTSKIDFSFFNRFIPKEEIYELTKLDPNILNTFYQLYHKDWVDEGISPRTMAKFGIRFAITDNQIIIPHFDIEGNLIGVRARNMDEEMVAAGMKYFPVRYKKDVLRHPTGAALYGLNFNIEHVEKYRTVILFEAEKSVMQLDTIWPDMSIGACVSGSSLSMTQVEILKSLNVENVIIAPDKEFAERGSDEEAFYWQKVESTFIDKLGPYFNCHVMWDKTGLLGEKMSPTDKGKEIFEELWKTKFNTLGLTKEKFSI